MSTMNLYRRSNRRAKFIIQIWLTSDYIFGCSPDTFLWLCSHDTYFCSCDRRQVACDTSVCSSCDLQFHWKV